MVRSALRRHIPDPEFAGRLVALTESVLADIQWLKDPPLEATTEELLGAVRAGATHLRSLGELLSEVPESVSAAIPEALRFEVEELAELLRRFGRFGEGVYEGLRSLTAWAEEAQS